MAFYSGVGGKVTFDTTSDVDFDVIEWSIDQRSRLAETTSSSDSGWASYIGGVKEASITFSCVWNDSKIPETSGPGLGVAGTLKAYMGGSTKFYSASFVIEQMSPRVNTRNGEVTINITAKATGAVTPPS